MDRQGENEAGITTYPPGRVSPCARVLSAVRKSINKSLLQPRISNEIAPASVTAAVFDVKNGKRHLVAVLNRMVD